jgi:phosphoglycerate dehydrogenase-like enzyme
LLYVAVMDDFSNQANNFGDWSRLENKIELTVFNDSIKDEDKLVERLQNFNVVIVSRRVTLYTRSLLEKLPRLKLLITAGNMNQAIDVAAAKELGILVCGTIVDYTSVAEMTWALILAAARNLPRQEHNMRQGNWQLNMGLELRGKVLGILGLGQIGSLVAKMSVGFQMETIAWSHNLTQARCDELGVSLAESLDDITTRSDFLVVMLRAGPRNQKLIGAREFKLMKQSAFLINNGRAAIVDEDAMIQALQNDDIAGAAIDVYPEEPLPTEHPLYALDNVILTPHISPKTDANVRNNMRQLAEDIEAFIGGKPINVIEPPDFVEAT